MKTRGTAFVVFFLALCLEPAIMCANPLLNPPYSVDSLVLVEGAESLLRGADVADVTGSANGREVRLEEDALRGTFVTPPVRAEFEFNEAIPSWNGTAGSGGGFRVSVRVRGTEQAWSPWLEFGNWGEPPPREDEPVTEWDDGHVEIDILFADRPAREFQFRVDLVRESVETPSPALSLLAFSYSNTLGNRDLWEKLRPRIESSPGSESSPLDLSVPFRSQKWEDPSLAQSICSPTSVAMVLEFLWIRVETAPVARLAFDPDHGIYGNWSRNVEAAAQLGARGYVDRFRLWNRVRKFLETGRPIVAAIRFERGELEDPPYDHSTGHLLVVRGFTADGDIITNDPFIAENNGGDGCVWKSSDLAVAWFGRGGVGYVLGTTGPEDAD